jgi:microsomal epoxide hydrolase
MIGEKFIEWTDDRPALSQILVDSLLYYFTSNFPTYIYLYRALDSSMEYVKKLTDVSRFPHELMPALKHVVEKNANLVFYKSHEKGGHFAALDRPEKLWADIKEFLGLVWKV